MNILILGGGGREHVLAWKIKQSSQTDQLFCIPGNGGIAEIAQCVDIPLDDKDSLVKFAKEHKIELTVVGPEAPLVEGIVETFQRENLRIFGPNMIPAQLEGSKVFAKEFMKRCHIPTADFEVCSDVTKAKEYVSRCEYPLVIKADGLAAGKGVIICKDLDEAEKALDQIMVDKAFKEAGNQVIIEKCLEGEEASILAISDGTNYVVMDPAQDHKRIFDDDLGPNTGGMGAYSPAPVVDNELLKKVEARVIDPVIRGMKREGNLFKGVLYVGLMITEEGPMVLEFNVRFGDPEAQAVIPRLKNDLVEIMHASCEGQLNDVMLAWDRRECVCVVMTSGGYPGEYETGKPITGIQEAHQDSDVMVFHAGTKIQSDQLLTAGGRVLNVCSFGETIEEAIEKVYAAVEKIHFDKCFFRRDIGLKALHKMRRTREP